MRKLLLALLAIYQFTIVNGTLWIPWSFTSAFIENPPEDPEVFTFSLTSELSMSGVILRSSEKTLIKGACLVSHVCEEAKNGINRKSARKDSLLEEIIVDTDEYSVLDETQRIRSSGLMQDFLHHRK